MVLMVVVVVAVGGVFAHLSAYRGEPRLPLNLWKSLWISLWKNLLQDTYLYATLDGSLMCKIWLFGMGRSCEKQKDDGPRKRAEEEETAPFCFVFLFCDVYSTRLYMFIYCLYICCC